MAVPLAGWRARCGLVRLVSVAIKDRQGVSWMRTLWPRITGHPGQEGLIFISTKCEHPMTCFDACFDV